MLARERGDEAALTPRLCSPPAKGSPHSMLADLGGALRIPGKCGETEALERSGFPGNTLHPRAGAQGVCPGLVPFLFSAQNRGEEPPPGAREPRAPLLGGTRSSLFPWEFAGGVPPLSPACLRVTANTASMQSKLALINQPPDYSLEEPMERTVLPEGGRWA